MGGGLFQVTVTFLTMQKLSMGKPLVIRTRRVRRGGALGAHAPPWKKSSAQKCLKEERKFCLDMSAKKNVQFPLRYDKITIKKRGKKKI